MSSLYLRFEDLEVGDTLWDMHDGFGNLPYPTRLSQSHFVAHSSKVNCDGSSEVVRKILASNGYTGAYLNKMLVVVDACPRGRDNVGIVTAVWSYDDRWFGMAELQVEMFASHRR